MNMSNQSQSVGETDITALAEYPDTLDRRSFVFVDWWPNDGYGNATFESDIAQLEDRLGEVTTRVDVAYLPRDGELQFERRIGE